LKFSMLTRSTLMTKEDYMPLRCFEQRLRISAYTLDVNDRRKLLANEMHRTAPLKFGDQCACTLTVHNERKLLAIESLYINLSVTAVRWP
jgi:hypothetical protein